MSDQNIPERLEDILWRFIEYSFELGKWGEVIWIDLDMDLDMEKDGSGYDGKGKVVYPQKVHEFKYGRNCNSSACVRDIYYSRYRSFDNSYMIVFIKYVGKDMDKIKYMVRDIKSEAYDLYNKIRNLYLDPSRDHLVSVYFRRDTSSYNKIIKEIKKGIIFEKPPALKSIGFKDQPAFIRSALVKKKSNKYNNRKESKNELDYPNSFKFSYIVYEK
jgi:hypothetical protein